MALTFRNNAHSEVGLVRKNNQDSAYVSSDLLVVADGMGGAAAGDLASAVAVEAISDADAQLADRLAEAAERRRDAGEAGDADVRQADLLAVLSDALRRANQRLAALSARDPGLDGMGTTLCGVALLDDRAAVVNIGDSRAYLVRDGVLTRISRDHSWVQTLVDAGRITEEEALEHPHRSLILRVLNGNPHHAPDVVPLELQAGDRVLVCSDGLCGLVTDARIAEKVVIPDREIAVASLVDLAHDAGGYDNITVVLADVVDGEPEGQPVVLGAAQARALPDASEPTARVPQLGPAGEPFQAAEDERYAPLARRGGRLWLRVAVGVLLPLVLLVAGGFGWYYYSQTRFYIGPTDSTAAVFQGVPDLVLGRQLSHVVLDDGVKLADLPPFYLDKVRGLIQLDSLPAGQARLAELKALAERCVAQRAAHARATAQPTTPSPTPTATSATAKTTAAGPSPQPTTPSPASPSPTPSPTPPSAPEDC